MKVKRLTLSNFIFFAAGAAVGSAVAWKFLKTKYEQIAQDEINEMKAYYSKKTEAEVENVKAEAEKEVDIRSHYKDALERLGYTDYTGAPETKEEENVKKPYVISPDEFGEKDNYETYTLYLYEDKILTDEQDIPIEDVDNTVGYESLTHFGQYEEDSVFVRNDRLKTDYEILLEPGKYSEVVESSPHPSEDE